MTKVAISPEPGEGGAVRYRAIAGERQSVGKTAGEALDALLRSFPPIRGAHWSWSRTFRQISFSRSRSARLEELMTRWRAACEAGVTLPAAEQGELDTLVQQEVAAAGRRAAALRHELDQ